MNVTTYILILCLLFSGCHSPHYPEKTLPQQEVRDRSAIQRTDLHQMMLNHIANRRIDLAQSWNECQYDLDSVYWMMLKDQWIHADQKNQKFFENQCCSLSWPRAHLYQGLLFEQKHHWNRALLAIDPIFDTPEDPAFIEALALSARLRNSRVTSVQDLSPQEESQVERQKVIWECFQNIPHQESIEKIQKMSQFRVRPTPQSLLTDEPLHVVFLYDTLPSRSFFLKFLESFDQQEHCRSCDILPAHVDLEKIREAYEHPAVVTIAYDLHDAIDRECRENSVATFSIGQAFGPYRDTDYQIHFPDRTLLHAFSHRKGPLFPELILTEGPISDLPLDLIPVPVMEISHQNYERMLNQILAVPKRKNLFESIFPHCHYIAQPQIAPQQILTLTSASLLEKIHRYFAKITTEHVYFLIDAELLDANPELIQLDHMIYWNHPCEGNPSPRMHGELGGDLIPLINRLRWFQQVDEYVYHGQQGAYFQDGQTLKCERGWAKGSIFMQ